MNRPFKACGGRVRGEKTVDDTNLTILTRSTHIRVRVRDGAGTRVKARVGVRFSGVSIVIWYH